MRYINYWILIFLATFSSVVQGQGEKDSLIQRLSPELPVEDNLSTIIEIFTYVNSLEELNFWAQQAEPLLVQCTNEEFILRFHGTEGGFRLTWFDYEGGMSLLQETLQKAEKIADSTRMSAINYRIGAHYFYLNDIENSVSYFEVGLKQTPSTADSKTYANRLMALGVVYSEDGQTEKGIDYQLEAVNIQKEHKNWSNIPISLNNLAESYYAMGDTAHCLEILNESIQLADSLGIKDALYYAKFVKGEIQLNHEIYSAAVENMEAAISYWEERNSKKDLPRAYRTIYKAYKKLGLKDAAIETLEKQIALNESYFDSREIAAAKDIEAKYESEKKGLLLEKEKQEREWAEEQSRLTKQNERQNLIIFIIVSVFLIISVIYLYIRFKNQRRDKNTILEQKHLIEERSKEIQDSIIYAKRLQSAIMPTVDSVKAAFPDAFVLYLPKDIVAGDFYWMNQLEDSILIAAADCTGHGVPGAMVSVVCNNGLNASTQIHGLKEPAHILDKTREIVVREFAKSGKNVKDGMDISLCSISREKIKFSGAHNPCWLVRKTELLTEVERERRGTKLGEQFSLIEYKGDKQPIGLSDHDTPFTQQEINLLPEDKIYLFTDGYADQFGGLDEGVKNPSGKKFKYSQFKQLLIEVCELPFEEQRLILARRFEEWKGDLEQIDDVCIIGVKA